MNHVDDLIERLRPVDWDGANIPFGSRSRSRVRLFLEYLRRAAWWADHYQVREKWPFYDMAALVDPDVRATDEDLERLEAAIDLQSVARRRIEDTCIYALHFATLLDRKVELPDLPHPFDPLMIMYERGGDFMGSKAGGWEVDLVHIWHRKIENHFLAEPRVSLDPDELDALDALDALDS
jgi:hypothetical protein